MREANESRRDIACIVEGGAVVHIGIRDIIVIVERRRTAETIIVNTTTTKAEAETGTKEHTLV